MVERVNDLADGEGDLTKRIELDRRDEIGKLGQSFDRFLQRIHGTFIHMVRGSLNSSPDRPKMSAPTPIA